MQHVGRGVDSRDRRDLAQSEIGVLAGQRMSLCVTDENLRQRTDLHGLVVEARAFDPGILPVCRPSRELWLSFPDPRMKGFRALIVGMSHIFANRFTELLVCSGPEEVRSADVSVHDVATRQIIAFPLAVERKIG